ncbi:MAG: hypothetical protein JW967_01240 [Dehalococcoidales bacterium]|nr:hypothetical protein [Dehalococcoidales bacterium]
MKDFAGKPDFQIWLIGDSPPEKWMDKLDTPLDPRHPARHTIWTSVADSMQDRLYRQKKWRLDTSRLYIRNAMSQPLEIPIIHQQTTRWRRELKELLDKYRPKVVLTFGVDAFRMAVIASGDPHSMLFKTDENETSILGEEFRSRIKNYDDNKVNIIPLLHVSIALGFLKAHSYFVGDNGQTSPNYFDYVGTTLADLLLARLSDKPIWIK